MNEEQQATIASPSIFKKARFSRNQLIAFAVLFALIGGYFLIKSFAAAPVVASLQAEQMTLPLGGSVITDTTASGGKAVKLAKSGTATGIVNFPSSVTSLTVVAKDSTCSGSAWMKVSMDGTKVFGGYVSTSWSNYSFTPTTAYKSGSHKLDISFSNDYYIKGVCDRNLYVDTTNFYGTTVTATAPTVSLSVSPTSVTAGQAATLTWTTTSVNSCLASGAWSGTQATSGSKSTGAINQNSTYTLTCVNTSTNQSASANATVTVSSSTSTSTGPGTGFTGPWRNTSYTVPTSFTKTITTASAFKNLVSAGGSLAAGDVVHVVGPMTLDGCSGCHTDILKRLSSPASIYFDSNVVFAGDSKTTSVGNPSVNVDAANIYMYGGQVAGGMANEGVRVGPAFSNDTQTVSNIRWWGLKVHDVGGGGVDSFGLKNTSGAYVGSDHLDFDIETWNLGLNVNVIDPHAVKGTGVHAIYIGGGSEPPGTVYVNNSKFSVYSHDTSHCVGDAQLGESVQNTEIWVRGANLSYTNSAGGWTAARVMTPWNGTASSNNDANITVHDVEGHNIAGQIVSTDSLSSGPITVEYGRGVNALSWPTAYSYYSGKLFQPNSHVSYLNIQ